VDRLPRAADPVTVNMSVYFDGDPAVDSSRRHMERVLKGEAAPRPRRKWPLVLMALGGGGLWALWRTAARAAERAREPERKPPA
jgi:hypothetical protein